ncbi:unnamed protein product [Mytilus edulis]|uniref:TIR domain-containing protein n=1 Tax=Mytilus edulis TaxID=6550 RepID=A0A8S3REV2_MYTED|nr:unnamed protein product [Mytilus edulis]
MESSVYYGNCHRNGCYIVYHCWFYHCKVSGQYQELHIFITRISQSETGIYPLDSEEDYEYHAFVVYCDNDRKWVHNDLLNKLENEEGLQLCIHHRNFIVGDSISVNVDNFLKKSWKVLVIVSNNFAQSEWCQWEVDVVQERRRRQGKEVIVPIILETIDSKNMTSQLRTLLDSTHSLRYRSGVGSELFWKVLLESLRKPLDIRQLFTLFRN